MPDICHTEIPKKFSLKRAVGRLFSHSPFQIIILYFDTQELANCPLAKQTIYGRF